MSESLIHTSDMSTSTPQAKGSATISENISAVGVRVNDIRPWITRDVEKFQECSLDKMLKNLLAACSDEGLDSFDDERKERLFDDCLKFVLPICNGVAQIKNEEVKSSNIKEILEQYAKMRGEVELYPLFVEAANMALLFLQELEITDIRPADDKNAVYFQVHDPRLLTQDHQGKVSERKPDILLVSEKDATSVFGGTQDRKELFLESATKSPGKPFVWRTVRTFIEFKRSTNKMEEPPESYTFQEYTPPKGHEYLKMDVAIRGDAVPASGSANSRPLPLESLRQSACVTASNSAKMNNSNSRKRTSELADLSLLESQPKRQKTEGEKKDHLVIAQAGYYAAEMFSAYAGRVHVLGLIIIGDVLYLWMYDRQGAIQCSGLKFIQDLPRFLVLLLAMQRFSDRNWGLNPVIDPTFGLRKSHETTLVDDKGKEFSVKLLLSDKERVTHFGLNGRATNLFPIECKELSEHGDLVIKIFWGEASRTSEPDILKKVYEIAKSEADVDGHVPKMFLYQVFDDMSTSKIRDRLGLNTEGGRILYAIVFRKLNPITKLYGKDFLRAWWATVKCHLALWKNDVYHRDISSSNLMYYEDKKTGRIMGVLNDFDLASVKEMATGTERTGTVPFMALTLLTDAALRGEIKHSYEHDAESFIWVLIWIALRYDKGELRESTRDRPLDEWLKVDAAGCFKEKSAFLFSLVKDLSELEPGSGHEQNWDLAQECIFVLLQQALATRRDPLRTLDVDTAFQDLLSRPASPYLKELDA